MMHDPVSCPTCGSRCSPFGIVAHIQETVAAYYQLPMRMMVSARRDKESAHPRQVAMFLAREFTPKSLPDIGRRFGGRDHTTVMYAIKAVTQRMAEDAELRADVETLRKRLAA